MCHTNWYRIQWKWCKKWLKKLSNWFRIKNYYSWGGDCFLPYGKHSEIIGRGLKRILLDGTVEDNFKLTAYHEEINNFGLSEDILTRGLKPIIQWFNEATEIVGQRFRRKEDTRGASLIVVEDKSRIFSVLVLISDVKSLRLRD